MDLMFKFAQLCTDSHEKISYVEGEFIDIVE